RAPAGNRQFEQLEKASLYELTAVRARTDRQFLLFLMRKNVERQEWEYENPINWYLSCGNFWLPLLV
ncbi:hypothetical protein R0J87_19005, partial [Halomonas sp. SIMBA_159]